MDIVTIKYHKTKSWIWELASKKDQIKKSCQKTLIREAMMKFKCCKTKN
jgi:hypothetical protein